MKPEDRQHLKRFWLGKGLRLTHIIASLVMIIITAPILPSQYTIIREVEVQEQINVFVDSLFKDLKSTDTRIWIPAVITLGRLGYIKDFSFLAKRLNDSDPWVNDPWVRANKAIALGQSRDKRAVLVLLKYLNDNDSDPWVRANIALALGQLGDKRAVLVLLKYINDSDPWVRANVALALGQLGDKRAVPLLVKALKDNDPSLVRDNAASVSGKSRNKIAVSLVRTDLNNNDFSLIWANVSLMLGRLGHETGISFLLQSLSDSDPWVRANAALALGQLGDKRAVPLLVKALKDNDPLVQARAALALGQLGDKRAVPLLLELLHDQKLSNRFEALRTLKKLDESGQLTHPSKAITAIFFILGFLGIIISGGIGLIFFLRVRNPYPLSYSGHILLPEDRIAELIALKCRRQKQNIPRWKIYRELIFFEFLPLLLAQHIKIRLQNLSLPLGKKRKIK
jgi:HEAT repeat protein